MSIFHLPCLGIRRKRLLSPNVHDQTSLMFQGSQNSIHEHEATTMNTYVLHRLSLTNIFHITVTLPPVFPAIDINILRSRVKRMQLYHIPFRLHNGLPLARWRHMFDLGE